ncbi:MAG TPA: hypothetical protein VG650_03800 [Mycobacteriales bacterium]|nr:hypothetical protein [Mycobacteriales bacterium]
MNDSYGERSALSYRNLRLMIGALGILLPVVLVGVNWMIWGRIKPLPSISAYYYTHVGVWFVGTMFAIGIFLICYRYDTPIRALSHLTTVAGIAAIVVGLFPTNPQTGSTPTQHTVAHVHEVAASTLFVILGLTSLLIFPSADGEPEQFHHADAIYRALGITILASCAGAVIFHSINGALFYFELVAVLGFAVSWLIRGETVEAARGVVAAYRVARSPSGTDPR